MLTIKMFLPILKLFIYLLILMGILTALKLVLVNVKYKRSQYGSVSGNSLLKTAFDKGVYGEFLTFVFLEKLEGNNKLLTNVYIPKEDGSTTEIDLLMMNKSGVYVFESKNYSGWIFGDEKSKYWTQSLKGGKKNKFLNPIWQNKAHINALGKLLSEINSDVFYSYIVFSERCELKKVSFTTPNIYVVKRDVLFSALKKDMSRRSEVLSDIQISKIYETLKKHSLVDDAIKEKHIQSIKSRIENI